MVMDKPPASPQADKYRALDSHLADASRGMRNLRAHSHQEMIEQGERKNKIKLTPTKNCSHHECVCTVPGPKLYVT